MPKKFHMGIHMGSALKSGDRCIRGILVDESGRELSAKEVRATFTDEIAKGYVIFCGCDNRRDDGGCAGHDE